MTTPTPEPSGPRPPEGDARGRSRAATAWRVALAGGAAVGLLAVAAVAAGGEGGDSGGITLPTMRWLVAAVFVVLLLIGVAAFVALLLQPRERRPRSTVSQLRVLVIAAGIVIILLVLAGRRQTDGSPTAADGGGGDPPAGQDLADLSSNTAMRDVALLLGLVLVGATVAVVAAGRRVDDDGAAADDEERREAAALSDVLDEAVAALRAEPDPRRAVIAAYAHVERSLHFHRLPRRPSETALEFLGRLLEHLDASGPAIRRLTGLFEVAMFSTRAVDRGMQEEAVDALVAVRDELRSLAAGEGR